MTIAVMANGRTVTTMKDDLVNDCISRTAAIEVMRKAKDKSELHRMLVQLPSAQPGWIPCSERLPKLNGYYLTTIKWGEDFYEVDCYEYDSHYKEWNEVEDFGGTVVAWMPLPKPWEEEKAEGAATP